MEGENKEGHMVCS